MKEELRKEWYKGLLTGAIIYMVVIIVFSAVVGYPMWNKRDCGTMMQRFDTTPENTHVTSRMDCEEGCIYAEWIVYGYQNLTNPIIYTKCAEVCMVGDSYFKK